MKTSSSFPAARTAVASSAARLAKTPATELGALVIKRPWRARRGPGQVGEVIMGQVLAAGAARTRRARR